MTTHNDSVSFDINTFYRTMIDDVYNYGVEVNGTKEINNYRAVLFNVENPIVQIRNVSKRYIAAEMLWYFCGRNDVDFIGKYASMWKRLTDDGKTNNSAYGYIMKRKHGFDQIEKMIELLKIDPYSRRAIININVPNENVIETKDEMCTICLNFQLRNNLLNCTAVMRSNDIYFGVPMDTCAFITVQKYIAKALGVECGTYTLFAMSLHMYERDYDKFKDILDNPDRKDENLFTFNHDNFIAHYEEAMIDVEQNGMTPEDAFYKYEIYKDIN